jgi:imidazolonepropionase-like amidohydrolase
VARIGIRNICIIDGNGGPPVPDGAIVVEGDRLAYVGAAASVPGGAAERVVDGGGMFALPGFIDLHVHFATEGPDLLAQAALPASYTAVLAADRMRRTLEAGVTAVRDLCGTDAGIRRARDEGLIAGPRLQIAVAMLSISGGHGDLRPFGANDRMSIVCDGPAEVLRATREVIRAGADVVKVATTGGVLSPSDDPQHSHFSADELAVIAAEARRQGRPLAAHAQGADGIKSAVRAGFTTIEHGIYLDDEAIDLMLEAGTVLVPTLVAPQAVLDAADSGMPVPPWAVEKSRRVIDVHRDSVRRAHAAGVRLALGTDSGVGPHGRNLRELALLREVGLSPMDAILAGTRNAAAAMGLLARIGTLEAGKLADLVLTPVDPLTHLADLADPGQIRLVMQGGRVVKGLGPVAA